MVCPKCLSTSTQVYNSRSVIRTNQIWRRRRCKACGFAFSTREYIEADQCFTVLMANGHTAPFSRVKLLLSLAQSLIHYSDTPDAAFYLLGTIEHKLLHNVAIDSQVTTSQIIAACLEVLQKFDTKAYLTYLATYPPIGDARDLQKLLKHRSKE